MQSVESESTGNNKISSMNYELQDSLSSKCDDVLLGGNRYFSSVNIIMNLGLNELL